MSAESGISTFRDSGGLWEKYKIDDVATPNAWRKNPALVLDFYNQRRKQLLSVKPNAAHIGLAELEKDFDVQIITQNVDNLHERAGSTSILHLHGELMKVRSTGLHKEVFDVSPEQIEVNPGDKCPKGYQLRPHIVWFGEDGLRQVFADFVLVYIDSRHEIDIAYVITAQIDVHQPGDKIDILGFLIKSDALH